MKKQDTALLVLIADHDPEVRQALRLVCEESLGLNIAAEVADTAELLTQIKTVYPTIVLLEWGLPNAQPTYLINALRADPSLQIIVMGGHPEIRVKALEEGADGFVYKGDPPDELIRLLRTCIETQSSRSTNTKGH
jgi:DNA-binding NarL/FixJ family response regulator